MNQYLNASRRLRSLVAACGYQPPPPRSPLVNATRKPHGLFASSPTASYSSRLRQRLGDWKHNGTPEIAFGVAVLAYAGVDYVLSRRQARHRADMLRQLDRGVRRDGAASRERDRAVFSATFDGAESRCRCIVRRVPRLFDGYRCLTDVRRGDVVEVIEEGVGPGGRYSFCSIQRSEKNSDRPDAASEEVRTFSIGWFPKSCLQKID